MASVIYFGANCALASNSAFLPTIIKTFGVCKCHLFFFLRVYPKCPAYTCSKREGAAPYRSPIRGICCRSTAYVLYLGQDTEQRYSLGLRSSWWRNRISVSPIVSFLNAFLMTAPVFFSRCRTITTYDTLPPSASLAERTQSSAS